MSARRTAFRALRRVAEDAYSNLILDSELKKSNMDERDKRFAASLFYGVLENEQQLDYIISAFLSKPGMKLEKDVRIILRMGIYQLGFMDRVPDSAAVDESVRLAKKNGLTRVSGFINGVLRSYIRADKKVKLPDRSKDERLFLSVRYSCPMWLIDLWSGDYGVEICEKILQSLGGRPPIYARCNTVKITPGELCRILAEEGVEANPAEWFDDALCLADTGSIEELEAYKKGLFHVQDLSSQICCKVLSPQAGETVLDVCAAPGGKSFTLAQLMSGRGRVISCDIHPHRVELIAQGAERLGLGCIEPKVRDALSGEDELKADRVLCDVPCSGLGIIRRKPDIKNKNAESIAQLPQMQYDILYRSSKAVRPGGVLVYSTCTLCREENSLVVNRFLEENSDFEPYPFELPCSVGRTAGGEPEHMLTLFPFVADTDGFFIARMKRKG